MGFWEDRRARNEAKQAEKQREREEFEAKIREQVARQDEERRRKAEELEAEKKRLLEQMEREKAEKRAKKQEARIQAGMSGSRATFRERMNVLLKRGPAVDDDFWDGLEEVLIMSDMGVEASMAIVAGLRETATRQALPDAYAVYDLLADQIAATFPQAQRDPFSDVPSLVLFVGINGAGKTTTVGKLAYEGVQEGRKVLLGSADTFRAAAIEQLEVWGERAGVEIVQRERGADPASVCYDTIERAEAQQAEEVLIDTAGRLHTSDDLMRELAKVVKVVRKRSAMPVTVVLVIDATTGQNGLSQAREFNRSLELDGIIVTKLDGTAKGGIAVAIAHDLKLPIFKIGVGESLEDLQDFDAREFALGLIGSPDDLLGAPNLEVASDEGEPNEEAVKA